MLAIKLKLIANKIIYPGLLLLIFLCLLLTALSKPEFAALGLTALSPMPIALYSLITLVACLLIYFISKYKLRHSLRVEVSPKTVTSYVLIFAPAQEFVFRSFLYYSFGVIGILNVFSMTLASSLLFGIAHIGFGRKDIVVASFILGAVWSLAYYLAPNLLLVSLSHSLIGLFAYHRGLITHALVMFAQAPQPRHSQS